MALAGEDPTLINTNRVVVSVVVVLAEFFAPRGSFLSIPYDVTTAFSNVGERASLSPVPASL
jgi:hypothetical protein